jgi:RNA-directed DNA polymerase
VLDAEWARTAGSLGVLVRFADDFIVLCTSRARAEQALRRVSEILAGLGLQLHPDKTRIVCLTRGREGVNFLGFHLHKVEAWRWRGRYYLQRWPSDRAMAQIRARIREATSRRFVGHSIAWVVANLNRVLRGWGAYFRYGNSARKFAQIDGYVHERLAIFASIKHGRHGRNYHRFTWGVVHQPGGLPAQRTRAKRRCACLTVNDVGKPCAGELHARFDRGPLVDQAMVS